MAKGNEFRKRPRLLLAAYACNPFEGSEPGVGWNRAIATSKSYDVWVLFAEHPHGPAVRRYLAENGEVPGVRFIAIQKNRLARILRRVPGLYYLSYRVWQWQAYQVAKELDREVDFDLAHQATFCTYREPGYLWKLSKPFVWGPLGGTQNFPFAMLSVAGRGIAREALRGIANHLHLRFNRRSARASRHARVVLAANSTVKRDIDRSLGCNSLQLLETGLPPCRMARDRWADTHLRLLWCGGVEPWKAPRLFLQALAEVPRDLPLEVRVVGDGSQMESCRRLAWKLNLEHQIEWLGRLSYRAALEQFVWANVFIFTSMRDTSGNVILEALSAGVPVITVDHQGASDIVTDECGIKVPVSNPAQCAAALAAAIARLAGDPTLRMKLSEGAIYRACHYTWECQGDRMEAIYNSVLGRTPQSAMTLPDAVTV